MPDEQPTVRWTEAGEAHVAAWHSEADLPAPSKLTVVDDRLTADQALRRLERGEFLLYTGDFHNARQLLGALGRRLAKRRRPLRRGASANEAFRRERQSRAEEHALFSRLLVPLDAGYRVTLRRGPEARTACEPVWGPPDPRGTVTSFRELQGMLGAAEWREKGVEIPGLPGRIHPHYGVFSPTRPEYPELLAKAPSPKDKLVFEIGIGTGVLAFLLLSRGAKEVVGTDIDPRAVACALDNAERLGFSQRLRVIESDLFPEGRADLVICNPPWVPEQPKTRIDRAIYDPQSRVLLGFLSGLAEHLNDGGEGWLIVSDLPERLGLRSPGWLDERIAEAGLRVAWTQTATPRHPKAKDPDDPLYAARSQEQTRLIALVPR